MIKKSFLVLCFLLGLLVLCPVSNADQGDLSFGGLFGGVGYSGSNMGQYGSNGFGYGGFITYAPSEIFDLDFNLVYSPHGNGANSANALYGTIALKTGMTFDQLSPYITAGVGVYRDSLTLSGVSNSAAAFGFNFGGGMDITLGKYVQLGLLVRYHPVLGKEVAPGMGGVDDVWDALLRLGFLFRTGVQGGWD